MISIGGVYKGPELKGSPINLALMNAARILNAARGSLRLGEAPIVNAVFVVSGSLGRPAFEGLEFGEFSEKDMAVVVQIAVPEALVQGEEGQFIVGALRGANAMAFEFFRRRDAVFRLEDAEKLVTTLADTIRTSSAA